jgi:hypothetical protein
MAHGSKLTLQRAAMIRELRGLGATQRALARAFLCSESLVRQVLAGKVWAHHPCDGCRQPISGERTSGLCEACKAQFCCRCGAAKFPTRRSPQCVTCDREKWRQHVTSREKTCRHCGEALPGTRRDVLCTECRSDEQSFFQVYRQQRAQSQGIACKQCGEPVPTCKSWQRNLCRPCANEHDRRRRALSRRLCGICERELTENDRGLCRDCRRVDARIRAKGAASAAQESGRGPKTDWEPCGAERARERGAKR